MNQPSAFQQQYPLSPRKFWKKMFSDLIGMFILIILTLAGAVVIYTVSGSESSGIGKVVFGGSSIIIILLVIYLALKAIYVKAYIKRYYYDCGEQFITIKKGVFTPTEIHVQYQKIQDVYVDQDLLDRVMGLYDVHIASATVTSGIEAHIDGVNHDVAESLKNIILAKIHGGSSQSASLQTPEQSQNTKPSPVQFSQKISSETYPVSGAWIVSAMAGSTLRSIIYLVFFTTLLGKVNYGYISYYILFFVFMFIVNTIWLFIWKKNYYFEFTSEFILLKTGVISRSENHLPYKSIQNVLKNEGILDRILGISTVTIQNAAQQLVASSNGQSRLVGSGIALVWQPKAKAEELSNILNDITSKINPQSSTSTGL